MIRDFACLLLTVCLVTPATAQTTLTANTTANNGGSAGWGVFFDFSASGNTLSVTQLTTASTAAANANFSVDVYTRAGSGLGGPVASGVGNSSAGWTMIGTATATQGLTASGISLPIDIPDITVTDGDTVGVALVFSGAGPRYFGTGTPPLQTFSDGTLTLITGDVRSAPFTSTGSFFSSRGLTGEVVYFITPVPEPIGIVAVCAMAGGIALIRRRRSAA